MSTYLEPLASINGNVATTKDGHVTLNYILDGFNLSLDNEASITNAQNAHNELIKSLAVFGLDLSLYGYKARTHPQDLVGRMNVAGLSSTTLTHYLKDMSVFAEQLTSGARKEFKRIYMLSVHVPHDLSLVGRALSGFLEGDEADDVDYESVASLEDDVFRAIPQAFSPRRANSDHFLWAYNRARLRAIEVPYAPSTDPSPQVKFNLKKFPTIAIEKNADGHALLDGAANLYAKGREVPRLRETFSRAFRTTRLATALSVDNVSDRRAEFPNGPTSYQSFVQVLSTPEREQSPLETFTDYVDWIVTLDADFAQHINYNFAALDKKVFRTLRRRINSENKALSKDDMDVEEFQDTASTIERWRKALRSEPNPIPIEVATLFCFAHQNLSTLEDTLAGVFNFFENNNYGLERIVGGQFDGYCQMLPGIKQSWLTDEAKLSTTSRSYSASMPMRTSHVGDHEGVPVAVNRANALGQIVYMDLLKSTDAGNGSIAVTGAQGSGKSHFMKLLIGYLADLEKTVYIVDPSPHGEYEVFARSISDSEVTVVNVVKGQVSLDPLKVYPVDKAQTEFMDIMLPLLDIPRNSDGVAKLANMLTAEYRESHEIRSTRDLMTWVKRESKQDKNMRPIANALNLYATQPYSHVLIDPKDSAGRIVDLPIPKINGPVVVFRTYGLDSQSIQGAESLTQRFTQAIMTQIADYSAWKFNQIADVCVFACDEFAEFKDNKVVTSKMIARADRMGRKERNYVLAGSQLPQHLGEDFALVKKRIILKQETRDNAAEAFKWMGLDSNNELVSRMLNDTSPIDPSTRKTIRGREGEGWFNDGTGNIVRIKILDHMMPGRSQVADTTSTQMIRA